MSAQPEGSSADEVNAAELARVLGVTEARIRQLAGAGVIPRLRHGVYPLREAVQGYLASKLESLAKAQGSSSADRVRDERAKEIAQRTALQERVLIHIHEATAALDEIVGAYLEPVSGLPARMTRNPRERERLEGICDGERLRLADRFARTARFLRAGSPAHQAKPARHS